MNVLIHPGMHKAASTYIQALLRQNRKYLNGCGVDIVTGRQFQTYISDLVDERNEPAHAYQAQLGAELAKSSCDNIVISAEIIERLARKPDQFRIFLDFLNTVFDGMSFFVIVRDPVEMISSQAQQRAKALTSFEAIRGKPTVNRSLYDYSERFEGVWNSGASIEFVPFNSIRDQGGPKLLSGLIGRAFGIEVDLPADMPPRNTSIGPIGVAAASYVRYSILNSINATGIPERLRREISDRIVARARENGWDRDRYFLFSDEEAGRIYDQLSDCNDAFARRAWGCAWFDKMPRQSHSKAVFYWQDADEAQIAAIRSFHDDVLSEFYQLCDAEGVPCDRIDPERSLERYRLWLESCAKEGVTLRDKEALGHRRAMVA